MIEKIEKTKCTGCFACYNSCPKNCITMQEDEEGFVYPVVDKEKCIKCGLCIKTCPSLNKVEKEEKKTKPQIYAAWSLNEEIRFHSTSGGVFSELAKEVLGQNGYVCGAQYNENNVIEHVLIHKIEDLAKIRQSKYAQSNIGYIYREIKKMLQQDSQVLFCGTPCECEGLRQYLKKEYSNLILCDFVCRGSNSPKVYRKFLEYLEKKYQSKVKKVWFKNKTYGWNRFSTKIEFENGKTYLKDRYSDLYIRGYIEKNLYMRPCCSDCNYKGINRNVDITLADFWGVKLSNPELEIEQGTSLVMIHSQKGEKLFDTIKSNLFYEEKTIQEALKQNPSIVKKAQKSPNRDEFMKQIEELPIERLIKKYCKPNIIRRSKIIIKNILGRK